MRFWNSRVAFGSYRYSSALVSEQFMEDLSVVNQYALETTRHLLKNSNRISLSSRPTKFKQLEMPANSATLSSLPIDQTQKKSSNKKTIEIVHRSLPSSSEPLSLYYDILSSSRSNTLVKAIDPSTMRVSCTLDLWLWIHLQGYFQPLSIADGRTWSILKLHGKTSRLYDEN